MSIDYSSDAFIKFLDVLPALEITNEATARNLKNSSMLLLSTSLGLPFEDMRFISVEELLQQYIAQAETPPSEASKQAYKSRFSSALAKFISYQNGETKPDVKELIQNPVLGELVVNQENTDNVSSLTRKKTVSRKAPVKPKVSDEVKTFELPIPLRGDLIITIANLPRDLSKEEARRISTIVESFAIPDPNDLL